MFSHVEQCQSLHGTPTLLQQLVTQNPNLLRTDVRMCRMWLCNNLLACVWRPGETTSMPPVNALLQPPCLCVH
jgi:hypothetical protein